MEALRGLSAQLVILSEGNLQTNSAELKEVAESALQTLVVSARRAKERQQQLDHWICQPRSMYRRGHYDFLNLVGRPDRKFPGPPVGSKFRDQGAS
jgi:hypothetical protein